MKVLIMGDSISYGWGVERERNCYAALLEKKLAQTHEQTVIRNQGIPGDTVLDGLARKEKGLVDFSPDYILLNFGTNDGLPSLWGGEVRVSLELFREKLEDLVEYFQNNSQAEIFLFTTTIAWEERIIDSLSRYNQVIIEVAREKEIELVDIFTPLQRVSKEQVLLGDGIHPSPYGHQLIFQALWEKLNK